MAPAESPGGRILALDLGQRRIGLALSDPQRIIAQPCGVVTCERPTADLRRLARLCAQQEVTAIVVGLPLSMDGQARDQAQAARAFMVRLAEVTHLPVHEWDERLTTVAAERDLIASGLRRQRRRQIIDQTAAALILQGFLDHLHATERNALPEPAAEE